MRPRLQAPSRRGDRREAGFTLAGLLVILTVLAVILAYSVPRMWSDIRQRERDHQLLFVMEQYARAIQDFQRARGALPVSIDQLAEQKNPRVLRQLYVNPLSGEVDWLLVPPGAEGGAPAPGQPPGGGAATNPPGQQQPVGGESPEEASRGRRTGRRGAGGAAPAQAFIGVRPPQSGISYIEFKGSDRYEDWLFTIQDLGNQPQEQPRGANPQSWPRGDNP